MKAKKTSLIVMVALIFSSCAIIRPGEVGVKQRFGRLSDNVLPEGAHLYNPFGTKIIIASVRTENIELKIDLPSKEGVNVSSVISILYHVQSEKVPDLIKNVGLNYEGIIRSVFRSASADVCAQFLAKDMHSGKRGEIEEQIRIKMSETLEPKGIITEAVLLKTVKLPPGLYNSIEARLQAEQDALRMKFILDQERLEAERKIIEAEGTRDAQIIVSEGLTPEILELKRIEALLKLSESESSKVIITNGNSNPVLLNE
jgi:regulator of protease activity HflC (stomatin/prohibitin superfamily)